MSTIRPAQNLSRAGFALAALVVGAAGQGGCGNYSNEDLEFMNALPQPDDVALAAPLRPTVRPADEDDALKMTIRVTTAVKAGVLGALAFVDKVRTAYPTAREQNTRIWGPFPDDNNPGWQVELRMTRTLATDGLTPHFEYEMIMIAPAPINFGTDEAPRSETQVLGGWFESVGRARSGVGALLLTPKAARDAGADVKDLDKLVTETIDYDNRTWPRVLDLSLTNEPPPDPRTEAESATYHYERAQNGDGGMRFSFLQDSVPGPLGVETLEVASRWRGTGEGQAKISVLAGDGMGFTWTDCWDGTSRTAYNDRPVDGAPSVVGDPATCAFGL
jgi:hypothetical protein